jgi:hypothetical protein
MDRGCLGTPGRPRGERRRPILVLSETRSKIVLDNCQLAVAISERKIRQSAHSAFWSYHRQSRPLTDFLLPC